VEVLVVVVQWSALALGQPVEQGRPDKALLVVNLALQPLEVGLLVVAEEVLVRLELTQVTLLVLASLIHQALEETV
jgi:hypothetical protein